MADDTQQDLGALENELTTEKREIALQMARGDFANQDRYARLELRLKYLHEATRGAAEIAPTMAAAAPASKPSSHAHAKDKDK